MDFLAKASLTTLGPSDLDPARCDKPIGWHKEIGARGACAQWQLEVRGLQMLQKAMGVAPIKIRHSYNPRQPSTSAATKEAQRAAAVGRHRRLREAA